MFQKSISLLCNFFILTALIFGNPIVAQEKCATDIVAKSNRHKYEYLTDYYGKILAKGRKESTTIAGVIKIPVVVHVIHSVKSNEIGVGTNISDEQIFSQFTALNDDYRRKIGTLGFNSNLEGADTEIEFCLASTDPNCNPTSGITRHYLPKLTFNPISDIDYQMVKSTVSWPSSDYLNIWVCSMSGGFLGLSQFPNNSNLQGLDAINGSPEEDGLMVNCKAFGKQTGLASSGIYNLGRTVTHEIGHWLGLLHTWGDEQCGTDYCNDTPPTETSFVENKCRDVYSKCGSFIGITRNMIENYLDYSPDVCMNIFTNNQKERMRSVFQNSIERINILSSNGCNSIQTSEIPFFIGFENNQPLADLWLSTSNIANNWEYYANGAFNLSQYALRIRNNSQNMGDNAAFSTASYINFENVEAPFLTFDLAYSNVTNTDSISIYAITGCNSPKILIKTYKNEELITSDNTEANFIPQKKDWQTKYLELKKLTTQKYYKIEFVNHSNGGAIVYLDNIQVNNASNTVKVKVIGNPKSILATPIYDGISRKLTLEILFVGRSDVAVEVYDVSGRMCGVQKFPNSIPGKFYLDFQDFTPGMYILKTNVANEVIINKIIIYNH